VIVALIVCPSTFSRMDVLFQPLQVEGFPINKDVYKHILPNVEEVEDQAVWYPIRMKSTGSLTDLKIGRMS
jgi:hypothetical protein